MRFTINWLTINPKKLITSFEATVLGSDTFWYNSGDIDRAVLFFPTHYVETKTLSGIR